MLIILILSDCRWFERLTMTVILFNCVTLGMYMWVLAILWVPVDCLFSLKSSLTRSINYYTLMVFQTFQLIYIWFICPIFLAYYESDENESNCQRLK